MLVGQIPSSRARLVVCDVGQGDAILIIKDSIQVLIDGGPSSEKVLACLGKQLQFWDHQIELIVMTNSDSDHIAGLASVVERYQVIQFVSADGVQNSETLDHLGDVLARHKVVPRSVERGNVVVIGNESAQTQLRLKVLWPPGSNDKYVAMISDQQNKEERKQILAESAKRGNLNERSVVLSILEDKTQVLLMGDAGDQTEDQLVELGFLPKVDILKVGHHGSRSASTLGFLTAIKPKTAIISVGNKNRYGHPTDETLQRLLKVGATIRRTDKDGEIVLSL